MKRLLLLVNGSPGSAMGTRAAAFAGYLAGSFAVEQVFRPEGSKLSAAKEMRAAIAQSKPDLLYVLDMSMAGVAAALIWKVFHGTPVVIDTGDAITALARSAKLRGTAGIAATWLLEEAGLRGANHIVVRGSRHQDLLAERGISATWIPDGFEPELFFPPPAAAPSTTTTIGLVGSLIWNGTLEATYGWDLVEMLAALPDLPLRGLVIGDGTGLERLRAHAQARGVAERIEFAGRVPYPKLREQLWCMDLCLSTQTNDLPGQVRTTGKLPLYLACGRFVLASRVGEAARVLPPEMLVDYDGARDLAYPAKLAARFREVWPQRENWHTHGCELARSVAPQFAYPYLGERLAALLKTL
ncbi:MAG: hypothetical protein OHK0021_24240 [Bryobacter sp.]